MLAIDFKKLKADIAEAHRLGLEAVEGMVDGGYIGNDDVMLDSLGRFSESKFEDNGIFGYKPYPGAFRLCLGVGGQGDKNTVGTRAAAEYLRRQGWDARAVGGYA